MEIYKLELREMMPGFQTTRIIHGIYELDHEENADQSKPYEFISPASREASSE